MRSLGNLLASCGVLALVVGGLIWFSNMPARPQGRPGDMWGAMNAGVANARAQVYPQCLYSAPSPGFSCPLDNNLHMVMWAGALLLVVGLLARAGGQPGKT